MKGNHKSFVRFYPFDDKYVIPFIKEDRVINRRKIRWLQIR